MSKQGHILRPEQRREFWEWDTILPPRGHFEEEMSPLLHSCASLPSLHWVPGEPAHPNRGHELFVSKGWVLLPQGQDYNTAGVCNSECVK